MRDVEQAYFDLLRDARNGNLSKRDLVYFFVKDRNTGDTVEIGVSNMDEDFNISVYDVNGIVRTRSYIGGGNVLSISSIVKTSGLTIETVDINLSQIADVTQAIVRQYDARLAKVEIHELLLDPNSDVPAAIPPVAFYGEIDEATITTPSVNSDGSITLTAASDAINMLTRKNPRKSSYEGQRRKKVIINGVEKDDEFNKYASTVTTWGIPWGQKA